MIKGNDVAHWQGAMNPSGTGFVMAKASQGTTYVDPTFTTHRDLARAKGRLFGSYHYAGGESPRQEAWHYWHTCTHQQGELLALDFEGAMLRRADAVTWARTFLDQLRAYSGHHALIYLQRSALGLGWESVSNAHYGLWLADWSDEKTPDVSPWLQPQMRQTSNGGGRLDTDEFYGNAAGWRALGS